jgi:hypothetical protein
MTIVDNLAELGNNLLLNLAWKEMRIGRRLQKKTPNVLVPPAWYHPANFSPRVGAA